MYLNNLVFLVYKVLKFRIQQVRAESPMEHIAQGKRSDTLGFPHSRVSAPCKGKSFTPLCCYSCLIADLAVLKWNTVCIFCSILRHVLKLLPLQGATAPTRDTQGVASLALGYVLHWAFSPPLLNPKLQAYSLSFVFFYFGCKVRANVESGQSL